MWPCFEEGLKSRIRSIWTCIGANLYLDKRLRWWRLRDDGDAEAIAEALRNCMDGRLVYGWARPEWYGKEEILESVLEEESSLDLNLADWMIETKGAVSTKDSRVMLKEIQWRKKLSTINL